MLINQNRKQVCPYLRRGDPPYDSEGGKQLRFPLIITNILHWLVQRLEGNIGVISDCPQTLARCLYYEVMGGFCQKLRCFLLAELVIGIGKDVF